eukprot:CAMPEP_0169484654 /NCGR_PEP_ID=MMETSP1042-20121227/31879_1 /TAXON_ID=464988 /ORGANISM="Hemiselmis andersenii, Strain CCMP1180" /LENGTH=64 /DNA_ID=CAMNT_0009599713 /DNA_START=315 /DNA_END=506 /DNA_ORIENTATION=+
MYMVGVILPRPLDLDDTKGYPQNKLHCHVEDNSGLDPVAKTRERQGYQPHAVEKHRDAQVEAIW